MQSKIWSLLTMISLFGCSPPAVTEQAKLLGTRTFSREAWATASQEQRGEMVFSFLSEHDPESLTSSSVKELLGRPTGYYDYEENPAYFVGSSSVESEYGKGYLLAFLAEKTSGKIVAVKIVPEPK
ncbi:MAG: hypothetical protein RBT39_17395 [Azoarcus sp.]|nr:hypothetical protein [Azoarcus sp.]MDX9839339.1 hypothetical protein [Azoarcus sp.]